MAWVVFVLLQVAFLPIAILGIAIVTYKQMVVSRRLGVTSTGIEVLLGRWTMHVFGMREDRATVRLAGALPNASTFGLWLFLIPLWVKYRLSGTYFLYPRVPVEGDEAITDTIVARTLYFDRIIDRVLPDMAQFVTLGAGYDTRAYGELRRDGLAFFEVDKAETQRLKIASLAKAGIASDHVTFVTVDFTRQDAFEELEVAGYDPSKKTIFLWEGVTLYLDEEDVRKTLRDIGEHAPPGSVVLTDIYAERFVRYASRAINRKVLEYIDEGMSFGLDFETDCEGSLAAFLEREGVMAGETMYLGRTTAKGPFAVVAELVIQAMDATPSGKSARS